MSGSVGTPSQEGRPEMEAWVEGDLALVTWRHGNDPDPFITSVGIRVGTIGWKVPDPEDGWRLTYASDKDCRSAVRLAAVVVSSPATPAGDAAQMTVSCAVTEHSDCPGQITDAGPCCCTCHAASPATPNGQEEPHGDWNGIEEVAWNLPHRALVDGLPLSAEQRAAVHAALNDNYQHGHDDGVDETDSLANIGRLAEGGRDLIREGLARRYRDAQSAPLQLTADDQGAVADLLASASPATPNGQEECPDCGGVGSHRLACVRIPSRPSAQEWRDTHAFLAPSPASPAETAEENAMTDERPEGPEVAKRLAEARVLNPDATEYEIGWRAGWEKARSLDGRAGRCVTCRGLIEYHDPTGDGLASFWSHLTHPVDGHDAAPATEPIHAQRGARTWCGLVIVQELGVNLPFTPIREQVTCPECAANADDAWRSGAFV